MKFIYWLHKKKKHLFKWGGGMNERRREVINSVVGDLEHDNVRGAVASIISIVFMSGWVAGGKNMIKYLYLMTFMYLATEVIEVVILLIAAK